MWKYNPTAMQLQRNTNEARLCISNRHGEISLSYISFDGTWTNQENLYLNSRSKEIRTAGRRWRGKESGGTEMENLDVKAQDFVKYQDAFSTGEGLSKKYKRYSTRVFDKLEELF